MPVKKNRGPVERLVAHDRWIVAGAAGLIVLLAGLYTFAGVGMNMSAPEMTRRAASVGNPLSAAQGPAWSLQYAGLMFLMWWFMMIAMMTPSAAPMLLLYASVKRMGAESDRVVLFSLLFLSGYLLAWAAFSFGAAGLQWLAGTSGQFSETAMAVNSRVFAGVVMVAAGVYQFSALKVRIPMNLTSDSY